MHLTSDELIRWRDEARPVDRARVVKHLAECDACGARLAELLRTQPPDAAPRRFDPSRFVARGIDAGAAGLAVRSPGRWRRTGWWVPAAAAAAILLAVLVVPQLRRPAAPSGTTRGAEIALAAPVGDVRAPITFTWTGATGASRYLVEIYDAELLRIAEGRTTGTRWTPGADVVSRLQPGRTYRWTVSALDSAGEPTQTSAMRRFTIVAPR